MRIKIDYHERAGNKSFKIKMENENLKWMIKAKLVGFENGLLNVSYNLLH